FFGLVTIVTGSKRAMVLAISATTSRAPSRCSPQVSDRLGQAIQQRSWGIHSAGMEKPSAKGVLMRASLSPASRLASRVDPRIHRGQILLGMHRPKFISLAGSG